MKQARLRSIPSVEQVRQALGPVDLPRPMVVRLIRDAVAELRRSAVRIPGTEELVDAIRHRIARQRRARLGPVINATGVLLHTNLGRSLLAPAAIKRIVAVAGQYSNLEFDLNSGTRGVRSAHLEDGLALLCNAPAATVVNNCAAALMIILRHLVTPERPEVVLSRGELVQIGGGFRIPEILEASGARLREVGTTNKTTAADYARAIRPQTALILKVHRSNFSMTGFVASPATEEIAAIARRARRPFVEDLGSGAIVDTAEISGDTSEPTPAATLGRGVDLVCFSGDKLLGGPQAGIIAGKSRLVSGIKREPFFRAVRCDKLVLAALEATVDLYLDGDPAGVATIPTLRLARAPVEALRLRAETLRAALAGLPVEARIKSGVASMGGGTLPGSAIESVCLELRSSDVHGTVQELAVRLRAGSPSVVAVVGAGWLKLDLRTILPEQDAALADAIRHAACPAEPS